MSIFIELLLIRIFLAVFSDEKKEIKWVPTSDFIPLTQSVKGFQPTVIAKDDVSLCIISNMVEFRLYSTQKDAGRPIW